MSNRSAGDRRPDPGFQAVGGWYIWTIGNQAHAFIMDAALTEEE